jgi:chemotaxis protein methyltransferase CheR
VTLDRGDFEYVVDLLRRDVAIALDADKSYLVESRLAPLARRYGFGSIGGVVAELRRNTNSSLRAEVVDAMTTNETSFFRDQHPFRTLASSLVPELMEARRARRSLTIWCGACSSGQEPYSIAMLIADKFPQLREWNLRIIASDVSAAMLGRAAAASYTTLEMQRGLPPGYRERFFIRDGSGHRLVDSIREMVEFRALNLASGHWSMLPPIDIAFIRNVLIYFDRETKRQILARVRRVLQPDGYLFLGGAETTLNVDDAFVRVAVGPTTLYQLAAARR